MELTEQKQLFIKCLDISGVAFYHSTYGWIVSTGTELIDPFSCEILTANVLDKQNHQTKRRV